MNVPAGEISTFLAAVGHEATDDDLMIRLIELLRPAPFDEEDLDDGSGTMSTWWTYNSIGVQLRWTRRVLVVAFLTCQATEGIEREVYPRPLFESFANTATRSEIVNSLGAPDATGNYGGPWIRYEVGGRNLHFSFFEEDDTLAQVGVQPTSLEY